MGRTSCTVAFLGRNMTANLNFVISNTKSHIDCWDEDSSRQLCSFSMMGSCSLRANLISARNAAVLEVQIGTNPPSSGGWESALGKYDHMLVLSLRPRQSLQSPLRDSVLGWLHHWSHRHWQPLVLLSPYTDMDQRGHSYEHKYCFAGCSLGRIMNNNNSSNNNKPNHMQQALVTGTDAQASSEIRTAVVLKTAVNRGQGKGKQRHWKDHLGALVPYSCTCTPDA